MSKLAMRARRKKTKMMSTIEVSDPYGILAAMSAPIRTAYITRALRCYIRRAKK